MDNKTLQVVDLFSGCGGLSLGFQNAGFNVIAAFDKWEPAVQVYRENFDHPIYTTDLSSEEGLAFVESLKPNMIIGGPPCQDFSSAGKRDESLGRADLTLSFANIVSACKPEWFLMENVQRITKSHILTEAKQILKDAGYGLSISVLDASYCGVPQARKRFIMVGHLFSEDGFLEPYLEMNKAKKPMTIFDYLGDSLGVEHYYRHPRSYLRRAIFSIHEPSPTIRGVNRPVPSGYSKHDGDPVDVDENIRPLTTKERSYIQTFPENFVLKGTKTNLEQIIGNAVPVKLAEYVGNCIQDFIRDYENGTQIKVSVKKEIVDNRIPFDDEASKKKWIEVKNSPSYIAKMQELNQWKKEISKRVRKNPDKSIQQIKLEMDEEAEKQIISRTGSK